MEQQRESCWCLLNTFKSNEFGRVRSFMNHRCFIAAPPKMEMTLKLTYHNLSQLIMNKFKRRISIKLNKLSLHDRVEVTFVRASGERIKAKGKVGDSLLDVIVNSNLDFDGFGACEGTLTCSTCHLIFSKPDFDKLPEKSSDEELDMLDLAYDLTDTSRLGCQIYLSKDMNGLEVKVCELNFPPFHLSLTD